MRVVGIRLLLLSSFFAFGTSHSGLAEQRTLWKLTTPDNPLLKTLGKEEMERVYGSKLFIIDDSGTPPKKPIELDGTVLHRFEGEFDFVKSKQGDNPGQDWFDLNENIAVDKPHLGITDMEDKYDEGKLLQAIAPGLAPPDTFLASEFRPDFRGKYKSDLDPRVAAAMKKHKLSSAEHYKALMRVGGFQMEAKDKLEKYIVKVRSWSASEGKLPKHSQDWVDKYADYLANGNKEGKNNEAEVLEEMLDNPKNVVLQKMVNIDKEARIHIVNGKIIRDAGFLRFYHLNEYLSEEELNRMYDHVEKTLLNPMGEKLGEKYKKRFSAAADIAITKEGNILTFDLNAGLQSGYFRVGEDVFTTNLLSEAITGERTPFLKEWDGIDKMPMGEVKARKLGRFFGSIAPFMEGDVKEAYWDRVIRSYMRDLKSNPTPERFDQALKDFRQAGLRKGSIYMQFANEVQDVHKISLSEKDADKWAKYINSVDPAVETLSENGKLSGVKRDKSKLALSKEKADCLVALQELGEE